MNISQDTFNKLVTFSMLIYFMAMFAISYFLGRPLDIASIAAFLVPMVTHTTHLLTASVDKKTDVSAISQQGVENVPSPK